MTQHSLHIYKASAGAGKTFTLAAEYIGHLLNEQEPLAHHHLLAITFTKKATNEMKERIMQYLYALAHHPAAEQAFLNEVRRHLSSPLSDQAISKKAEKLLRDILHGYDRFGVKTIDSFFQGLLSQLAHELGLSAGFKVDLNDQSVLSKAVDQMLSTLDKNDPVADWVTRYIQSKLDEDKPWQIHSELKELAKQLTKEDYLKSGNKIEHQLTNQAISQYREVLRKHEETSTEALVQAAKKLHENIESGLTYEGITSKGKSIRSLVNNCITRDFAAIKKDKAPKDATRKQSNDWTSLLRKADQSNATKKEQAESISADLKNLIDLYDASLSVINSCKLSLEKLNPLRLLKEIENRVQELNKENNAFLLAHTPQLFNQMVTENEASFVFERAGTTYHHSMVDEFQDTSTLQWSNLKNLFVENMAQGFSNMLVGDVKQGIYRWRGGDWRALAGMKNDEATLVHTLEYNFRSGKTIVEFNNAFFVKAAEIVENSIDKPEPKDGPQAPLSLTTLYAKGEVEQKSQREGGFVRVSIRNSKDLGNNEENDNNSAPQTEQVDESTVEADLFRQMQRLHEVGVPYHKMAILVRKNIEAKKLMRYHEKHREALGLEMDLVSDEAYLLSASPALQTIISTLRHLVGHDEISQAYIIKEVGAELWDKAQNQLSAWKQRQARNVPFYSLIQQIIALFNLHQKHGQSPYIYAFLDHVLQFLDDHAASLPAFLQHWDEQLNSKSIPSSAVKGVQIVTIHKSKGLAYHSLFIPYADWSCSIHNDTIFWAEPKVAPFNEIPLLPIRHCKQAADSIYSDYYYQEVRANAIENLNLLYVAFTRAEQNLLVWVETGGKKNPNMGETLKTTLEGLEGFSFEVSGENPKIYEAGTPAFKAQTAPPTTKADKPHNRLKIENQEEEKLNFQLYPSRIQFRQSHSALSFNESLRPSDEIQEASTDTQELARQKGTLLHEMMEHIAHREEVDSVIRRFETEGKIHRDIPIADLKQLLHTAMSHPKAKDWFDGSWRLYREAKILMRDSQSHQPTTRKPDRVMVKGDQTIIVDYKFGRTRPDYHNQVRQYAELLRQMGHTNIQGYLWYVTHNEIEEVQLDTP